MSRADPAERSRGSRIALIVALSVAWIVLAGLTWPYTMDDAYISLRYADHLANGYGLAWNPGGEPVEGFSNFLWVLGMAVATLLPGDPMFATKVAGAGFGLATVLLLAREGREVVGEGWTGLLPAAFLGLSPMYAFWSVSGIEMPAFAFALLAGFRGARRGQVFPVAVGLSAATLLRPEGVWLAAIVLGVFALAALGRGERDRLARIGSGAAFVVGIFAAYQGWRWWRFGGFVANTVVAKWRPLEGLEYFVGDFLYFQAPHLILAAGGLLVSFRMARRGDPRGMATAIASVALVAAQAAALANTRPAMGTYQRLFWPVVPYLYLLSARGLALVAPAFRARWPVAVPVCLLAVFPVLRDVGPVRMPGATVAAPVRATALAVREILRTVHAPLADWLREERPGASVALTDCGLLPYRSGAHIIDLWGLNDPKIARNGFDAGEVLERRPDLLVLASRDSTEFRARFPMDGALRSHPIVARSYRLAGVYSWINDLDDSGDYSLWVYERADGPAPAPEGLPGGP